MDPQQILSKAQNNSLSEGEWEFFLKEMDKEMSMLKEKNPEKYLEFLKVMNETFSELNTALKN